MGLNETWMNFHTNQFANQIKNIENVGYKATNIQIWGHIWKVL